MAKSTTQNNTVKVSMMTRAIAIAHEVYGDSKKTKSECRRECLKRFMDELGMKNTTATTYHDHFQKRVIAVQQDDAIKRVEKALAANKEPQVWTAYRTGKGDKSHVVTFAGTFTTRAAAKEANELLRLGSNNVRKGYIRPGQVIPTETSRKSA